MPSVYSLPGVIFRPGRFFCLPEKRRKKRNGQGVGAKPLFRLLLFLFLFLHPPPLFFLRLCFCFCLRFCFCLCLFLFFGPQMEAFATKRGHLLPNGAFAFSLRPRSFAEKIPQRASFVIQCGQKRPRPWERSFSGEQRHHGGHPPSGTVDRKDDGPL